MERLTNKREADAQREEYERRLANGYPRNIPEERFLRLAAYEDTGWTPEMLHKLGENAGHMWDFAQAAGKMTVGRLKELAEADKDGHVVVQPCRQGDELWTYCNHPVKRVYSFTVSDVSTLNGRTVLNTLGLGTIRPEDIGKTVFRTREEAERAMEGRKDG